MFLHRIKENMHILIERSVLDDNQLYKYECLVPHLLSVDTGIFSGLVLNIFE